MMFFTAMLLIIAIPLATGRVTWMRFAVLCAYALLWITVGSIFVLAAFLAACFFMAMIVVLFHHPMAPRVGAARLLR
jgi:hypothetical protein